MRKKYLQVCVIVAIAAVMVLWLDGQIMAQVVQEGASASSGDLLGDIEGITSNWWEPLGKIGQQVFLYMVTIELAFMGIRLAFQKGDIQDQAFQFMMFAISSLLVWALILYYEDFCGWITNGLMAFSNSLPTGRPSVDVGHPLAIVSSYSALLFKAFRCITIGLTDFDFSLFASAIILTLSILLMFLVLFGISAVFLLVKAEFYVLAPMGVIFVGLGGLKIFRDYTTSVMRYILSVGLKLLVTQLLMNICLAFLDGRLGKIGAKLKDIIDVSSGFPNPMEWITEINDKIIEGLFPNLVSESLITLGYSVVILCLVAKIPEACSGLISGASIGGMNPVMSMARTGTSAAIGATTGIATAGLGFGVAAKAGYNMARLEGKSTREALMGAIKSGAGATFWGGTKTGSQLAAIKRAAMPPEPPSSGTGKAGA